MQEQTYKVLRHYLRYRDRDFLLVQHTDPRFNGICGTFTQTGGSIYVGNYEVIGDNGTGSTYSMSAGTHQVVNGICQICGHGTYIDESDGKKYKIVKIGDQILMAENYAKRPKSGISWAYDDTETNVDKYGLLYDWETARNTAPKGWHLPTKDEWEKLHLFLGGDDKKVYEQIKIGGDSGFENTFGGFRTARGAYNSLAASAHFWSATPEGEKLVWYFKVGAYSNNAKLEKGEHNLGLSVRFFRDK